MQSERGRAEGFRRSEERVGESPLEGPPPRRVPSKFPTLTTAYGAMMPIVL